MSHFTVVLPAYNEARTIRDVVQRALQVSPQVIVVDDGSSDGTLEQVRDLPVRVLQNTVNQGKAASLWRGMQVAIGEGAEGVITLDADGQHKPEDIPRFIEAARLYPRQVIIGSRLADKAPIPSKRYYANKIANFWISWAAGYAIEDSQSGFRLYPAALLSQLSMRHDKARGFVFESEILIKAARLGFRSRPVRISAIYQADARASHFRPVLDIVRITRMVAWALVSRGLNPVGFMRAFLIPRGMDARLTFIGGDGLLTLLFSNLVILATGGLSWLWAFLYAWRIAINTPEKAVVTKTLLVLGMRLEKNEARPEYVARLQRAAELSRLWPAAQVLILGGRNADNCKSEAEKGKELLVQMGVKPERILMEEGSRHTLENLHHARDMLGERLDQVVIITNRYHLARVHAFATGLRIPHVLCAAEPRLPGTLRAYLRLLRESYYLQWYQVGKYWSRLIRHKKSLGRIT